MKKLSFIHILSAAALALLVGCGGKNNTYNPSIIPGNTVIIAYAGHGYSEDIEVIDVATMTVLDTIVGAGGYRMAISNDGLTIYSTGGDSLIYVSSTVTNTLTTSFDPSDGEDISSSELEAIVLSPDGTRLYVFDEHGDTALFVIDTSDNSVLSATALDLYEPENVVISPDGAFLYVVDNRDLLKISTSTLSIVNSTGVDSDAHGVAINSAGTFVYAASEGSTAILGASTGSGIDAFNADTLAVVTNIGADNDGYHMDNRPGSSRLFAVNESSIMSVMNSTTNALIADVTLSSFGARGVMEIQNGAFVLVCASSGLLKLDGGSFAEVAVAPGGGYQSVVVSP